MDTSACYSFPYLISLFLGMHFFRPPKMTTKEFNIFKKKAIKFKVQDNYFFCRNNKNIPMCQVVDNSIEQQTIF